MTTIDEKKVIQLMHDNSTGLSITEIVNITKIPRSSVRITLAKLEGARRVSIRRIGMAKVYILNRIYHEFEQKSDDDAIVVHKKPQPAILDNTIYIILAALIYISILFSLLSINAAISFAAPIISNERISNGLITIPTLNNEANFIVPQGNVYMALEVKSSYAAKNLSSTHIKVLHPLKLTLEEIYNKRAARSINALNK